MTEELTEREKVVLEGLIRGETNKMLAAKLFISVSTVKAHVSSILHKLNVTNRVEAAVKGVYMLIEMEENDAKSKENLANKV
ncbi:response regulator transcription factor [bacterium]|nr:response regulator transcription factor [bacterium]